MPTNQALQIAGIPRTLDTVPTHQIRPTNIGPNPTGRSQMCLDSRAKPRTKTGPRGHLSVPLALRVLQRHITKVAAIRSSPTPESLQAISSHPASERTLPLPTNQPNCQSQYPTSLNQDLNPTPLTRQVTRLKPLLLTTATVQTLTLLTKRTHTMARTIRWTYWTLLPTSQRLRLSYRLPSLAQRVLNLVSKRLLLSVTLAE